MKTPTKEEKRVQNPTREESQTQKTKLPMFGDVTLWAGLEIEEQAALLGGGIGLGLNASLGGLFTFE